MKASYPQASGVEIGKMLRKLWKKMGPKERKAYTLLADNLRAAAAASLPTSSRVARRNKKKALANARAFPPDHDDDALPLPSAAPQRPLLVLLDLNGVLVHRAYSGAAFSVRHGAPELLATLHNRVDVGFCSSMKPDNARRALKSVRNAVEQLAKVDEACGNAALEVLEAAPLFAGDEYHFRNDIGVPILPLRVPTLEPFRMLRNLAHVWQSSECMALGHTAASTILVDDTPGKCPLSPQNVVLIGTWDGTSEGAQDGWDKRLATHLLAAASAHTSAGDSADVRRWLKESPF